MHELKYDVIGLGGSNLALTSTLVSQQNFEGDILYNQISKMNKIVRVCISDSIENNHCDIASRSLLFHFPY